jgi:hypothetical protein
MPLYIVRWANLSASLVRARDTDHLQQLLDEEGDPGAAIWEEYDGPVWIEFEPDRRQTQDGEFELAVKLDAETELWDILKPRVANADTCTDMYRAIMTRLFPHIYVALRRVVDMDPVEANAVLREAIKREGWQLEACNERWGSNSNPDTIMATAGLSVIPKHIGRAILDGLEVARNAGHDIESELMALAAQQQDDIAWQQAQYVRLIAERSRVLDDDDYADGFGDVFDEDDD